jgi:hypothetical protein
LQKREFDKEVYKVVKNKKIARAVICL